MVTFVPELACGYSYHGPMADEMVTDSVATKVKREHILIKKYSTEDPVTEVTKGIANAIPVWGNADPLLPVRYLGRSGRIRRKVDVCRGSEAPEGR